MPPGTLIEKQHIAFTTIIGFPGYFLHVPCWAKTTVTALHVHGNLVIFLHHQGRAVKLLSEIQEARHIWGHLAHHPIPTEARAVKLSDIRNKKHLKPPSCVELHQSSLSVISAAFTRIIFHVCDQSGMSQYMYIRITVTSWNHCSQGKWHLSFKNPKQSQNPGLPSRTF